MFFPLLLTGATAWDLSSAIDKGYFLGEASAVVDYPEVESFESR